jgi:hypothetical protein
VIAQKSSIGRLPHFTADSSLNSNEKYYSLKPLHIGLTHIMPADNYSACMEKCTSDFSVCEQFKWSDESRHEMCMEMTYYRDNECRTFCKSQSGPCGPGTVMGSGGQCVPAGPVHF